jgi:hypothetical protein
MKFHTFCHPIEKDSNGTKQNKQNKTRCRNTVSRYQVFLIFKAEFDHEKTEKFLDFGFEIHIQACILADC